MTTWVLFLAAACAAETLEWTFDEPGDVTSAVHFLEAAERNGRYGGPVQWDPYVYLRLPEGGLDARQWQALSVRLYSSAPADVLDVYYQSPDGKRGLGAAFPIVAGWATYNIVLADLGWHESSPAEGARQWGGTGGRIGLLRLDPGNEAERWVMFDWVRLQSTVEGSVPGVVAEPMGAGRLIDLRCPETAEAGTKMKVSAEIEVTRAPGSPTATAFIRLGREGLPLAVHEAPVGLSLGRISVEAEFPLLRYMPPQELSVEAGVYELALSPALPRTVRVTNTRAGSVRPPLVTVERLAGDPTLHIDGRPTAAFLFVTATPRDIPHHAEMARAGIHLYCDWFGASGFSDLGHVAPDRYDYTEFDRYFAEILELDPEAYFLPHIGVTPPIWWQQANPDELCLYADGPRGPQSFASEKWRRDVAEDLRRLIRHLRRAPYADRLLGYIPFSGYSAEWQSWGLWEDHLADYSQPALRAFRAWLKRKYRTDQALREAWADPAASLATATAPDALVRHSAAHGLFRDPLTERRVIDFYEFLSWLTADAIRYVCRVTKEACGRRSLVGTYYGYLTQHQMRQQDSSHLALSQVLESEDVDFLMSPPMYTGREVGGTSTFMSVCDALRLRGKLWLSEADYRTSLTSALAGYGRADTIEASRAVLLREFGEVLTKRQAVSWYDMEGGWLSDLGLLSDLGRMRAIMQDSLSARTPFHGEAALFIDERSFFYTQPHALNAALTCLPVVDMPRVGVTWDAYLLTDFLRDDLPDYRLYVCLNAFYLPDPLRQAIHRKAARTGATVLWIYAPGYCTDQGLSTEAMKATTGIAVQVEDQEVAPVLKPGDHPLAPEKLEATPGAGIRVRPAFRIDDPSAETIALRAADGAPAVALKRMDGWTSVYSASYHLPPALSRNLARAAGCHVYLDSADCLYADNQYLCLHASSDGEKVISLPRACDVTNAMTGERLASRTDRLSLSMRFGDTVLLKLEAR